MEERNAVFEYKTVWEASKQIPQDYDIHVIFDLFIRLPSMPRVY
jgi:hypothetical protein